MDESAIAEHLEAIDEQGYTIVRNAIEPALVEGLATTIRRVSAELGTRPRGNSAEGHATLRHYNLLAKDPIFQQMPVHENVLPVVEQVLDRGCLLSGMTAIDMGPGERRQPLHPDDLVMDVERPHVPLMCVSMWALSDFSAENGATRIVPGSHRFDHAPEPRREYETVPAEMPAGSVMIFHGSLWHGGGANQTSDQWRLGVNLQYCAGYIRPQQCAYLGIPREITETFSDRLLKLCGYSLYKGIMGHIDGHSPAVVLGNGRLAQRAYEPRRQGDTSR
jgi:ectoine hydroxylase-related dioxygenase (phytanoyl-CoA dioxygenase family)